MEFLMTHWPELLLTAFLALWAWVFVSACNGKWCGKTGSRDDR